MISIDYQFFIHNLFLMINLQTRPAISWYNILSCVRIKPCEEFIPKKHNYNKFDGDLAVYF